MPDHHLHPFFRFLVEHQELLTGKSSVEDKIVEGGKDGGALSLLGSVYGTVEDEDVKEESANDSKTNESDEGDDGVKVADSSGPEGSKRAAKIATERYAASKHSLTSKHQASFVKGNPSVSAVNVVERRQINTDDNATDKLLTSDKLQSSTDLAQPKLELQILEPPIEMKRAIEKIVDFIQKNGKELEATLAAQDVKYGMFPFLHPANLYHGYYRKLLQEAEELKSCDRGDSIKKEDRKTEKMDNAVKDDKIAFRSVSPDDSAKKEKLNMVSDKPKIESHNEPFKPVQPQMRVTVDANTVAAILQAARRGIRNPQLGFLSGKPLEETSQSLGNDGSDPSSKSPDLANSTGQQISGSADASEADSSEAGLSKEQKLKAERLKRAKMFVAKLKPGAQPVQQAEPSRSLSVEPLDSGISGSGANAANEREGSSVPFEAEAKQADDGKSERRSKRNYRSRSQRNEDNEMELAEGEEEESSMEEATEEIKTDKTYSSSRKRHDRHKHKTQYSSRDRHSRDKQKHESSLDDEYHSRSRRRHKHRKSSDRHELYDSSDHEREHRHRSSKQEKDVDYSKEKSSHHHRSRKHRDSSDDEHRHHRHRSSRRKHEDSSDDVEHGNRHKSSKRMKKDKRRVEEETISKSDQSDPKASPEDSSPYPQNEPTQVSDELRAKIRAMLADTL